MLPRTQSQARHTDIELWTREDADAWNEADLCDDSDAWMDDDCLLDNDLWMDAEAGSGLPTESLARLGIRIS